MTWLIDGNDNIDETINFLGTTNDQPLIIRTNHSANPAASERMRISAFGNVGIGTTNPHHGRLTLEDEEVPLALRESGQTPSAGGLWRVALDGGALRFDANSAAGGDFSSFVTPLTMTPGGNVGIGTPSGRAPGSKLEVQGELRTTGPLVFVDSNGIPYPSNWIGMANNIEGKKWLHIGGITDDGVRRLTLSADRTYIQGNLGIGTTTPGAGAKLTVAGGDITWGINSRLQPDQGGSIELGGDSDTPGTGTPYIDFHFQARTQDFNTRIINDADGQLTISAGTLRTLGDVAITGGATVGAGGNAVLKVRHIDGKHWQNDSNDALFLNWNTQQPVIIGQSTARASLLVTGDATIGAGSNGVLKTRHIDGKHWQNDNNDGLYLNWNTGQPVHIGGAQPASLTISGELFLQYGRTSITGFDGAGRGRGYHWIRSDANENELWVAFAYPFVDENGNEVAPRRIEGNVPFYGTFVNWSDARTKTNVRQLGRALDKLERIRGVTFNWSESPQALGCVPGQPSIGVIAQEVEAVFPELVSAGGTQAYKAVDYSGLTGVLIEAAKELKEDNEALRSRIEALERA
jgi:hypothetical protein